MLMFSRPVSSEWMPDITSMSAPTLPSVWIRPVCGNMSPETIFSSVDFPAPFAPDDADRLARLDLERDVAQHPAPRVGSRPRCRSDVRSGPGDVVAQQAAAPVDPEPLPDVLDGDGALS